MYVAKMGPDADQTRVVIVFKTFRLLCLFLLAASLGSAGSALAQNDPIAAVRAAMAATNESLQNCLPTQARERLAEAEKLYGALGEFEKEKVESEWKGWRQGFDQSLKSRGTAQQVQAFVDGRYSQAEGYVSSLRGSPEQETTGATDAIAQGLAALGDPENKKLLDADSLAKLQRKADWLQGELKKARSTGFLQRAKSYSKDVQGYLDNPKTGHPDFIKTRLEQAAEALEHCTPDDPDVVALKALVADQEKAFTKQQGDAEYGWIVKPALDKWESVKTKHGDKWQGWEDEATPRSVDTFREMWAGGGDDVGCPKTEQLLVHVSSWLRDEKVKKAVAKYADDPEFKKAHDEALALVEKAGTKFCQFTNKIMDEGEKVPATDRQTRANISVNLSGIDMVLHESVSDCSACAATRARIAALKVQFNGEGKQVYEEREAYLNKLSAAADAAWPGLAKNWDAKAKAKKLDAPAALAKIDDWKGAVVHFRGRTQGGKEWMPEYTYVGVLDGVPVCGEYDDAIAASINDVCAKCQLKSYNLDEVIGVVDGVCVAHERVLQRGTRDVFIKGEARDGVRIHIVGVKTPRFGIAEGEGTSLDGNPDLVKEGSASGGSGSSGGSSGRSKAVVWANRLVAWGMCGLLALAGALALAHGSVRYVSQLKDPMAKLGDALGWIGVGVVALGGFWFVAAIVLWAVHLCAFGSLPSVALAMGGATCGLDLLRSKGQLSPETASKLQPLGIVTGLGCLAAAWVHLICWDYPLL